MHSQSGKCVKHKQIPTVIAANTPKSSMTHVNMYIAPSAIEKLARCGNLSGLIVRIQASSGAGVVRTVFVEIHILE